MPCVVCGLELKRGQRFKSDRYKGLTFCSQECYNQYCVIRDKENSKKNRLKDYLDNLFTEVNWPQFMRQIHNLEQEYNLTDNDLRLVIKYAIEFEGYTVDEHYGLGQFERFIEPSKRFIQAIKASQAMSEDADFNVDIQDIKKSNKRKFRKHIDFD